MVVMSLFIHNNVKSEIIGKFFRITLRFSISIYTPKQESYFPVILILLLMFNDLATAVTVSELSSPFEHCVSFLSHLLKSITRYDTGAVRNI